MKKLMLMATVCLAGFLFAAFATAADTEKPKKEREGGILVQVKGVVAVTGTGDAQAVTITPIKDGAEPVKVVLDEKGKELLALNGKTINATGKQTKDGYAVKEFTEVAGGAEKKK